MATIIICDLCGKPMRHVMSDEHYKIKKLHCLWHESWWERIDVHEECRKKLFEAIEINKPKKEKLEL